MDGDTKESAALLSCVRCGKTAQLQCPKCLDLKLPREGAAFCTQDCFKASWSSHKAIHTKSVSSSKLSANSLALQDGWLYCSKKGRSRTAKLPHFDWTGSLRPFPISKQRLVPDSIEKPDWALD
ncbi:Methionine aminopeptidase 1A, partial [Zostera marina]